MAVMPGYLASSARTSIRRAVAGDAAEFCELVRAHKPHLHPWVSPAETEEGFLAHLATRDRERHDGFLLFSTETSRLVGVVNVNEIVRKGFQSAYLGYFSLAPRQGFMTDGLRLVIEHAFTELGLHRLEANIQPENVASVAVAKKVGFRLEGFSPRYLNIAGAWRDHERYAILADEWRALTSGG
jgi:ribosomal-protein-alanine N-acetyltransferase